MSATKILWGQVLIVGLIALGFVWAATEWTAWRLAFQPELGRAWFRVLDWPVYPPPAFFWWWFAFDAYAQNNPRAVPKFDANGDPKSGSYTDTESSAEFDTAISALTIDKTEPSPEHELMRGVHDDTTTYTLKVTNNGHAATNGNTVTDYLPAGLEFLGCGGVDNGSTHEYGDVDLTTTPTIGVSMRHHEKSPPAAAGGLRRRDYPAATPPPASVGRTPCGPSGPP